MKNKMTIADRLYLKAKYWWLWHCVLTYAPGYVIIDKTGECIGLDQPVRNLEHLVAKRKFCTPEHTHLEIARLDSKIGHWQKKYQNGVKFR